MEVFASGDVEKFDTHAGCDIVKRFSFVVVLGVVIYCGIHDAPVIVGIAMWVECDLLFCFATLTQLSISILELGKESTYVCYRWGMREGVSGGIRLVC